MALCRVTGTLFTPDGDKASNYNLFLTRIDDTVVSDYLGAVVPQVVRVQVRGNGAVDFTILSGSYYGIAKSVRDISGKGFRFEFSVPDAATAVFENCIGAANPSPPTPAWLQRVEAAVVEAEAAAGSAQQSAGNAAASAASVQALVPVIDEARALSDVVFRSAIEASQHVFPSIVNRISTLDSISSDWVRSASEPIVSEKFQDASGGWWVRENDFSISILEFGEHPGVNVDSWDMLQRALLFLHNSPPKYARTLDLCGLEWSVSKPVEIPSYVILQNGALSAIGDSASWTDKYLLRPRFNHGGWTARFLQLNCNLKASGLLIMSGANAQFVQVTGYGEYGINYTGGGCKVSFCGAGKDDPSANHLRTNKAFLSDGWGLNVDAPDGKFQNVVIRGKMRITENAHHILIHGMHCFMGSGVSETIAGGPGVTFTPTWTLASIEDVFCRKNGATMTPGVDYTVTLDGDGYPTFTFLNTLETDEIFIKVRLKDVTAWEIRGGSNTFGGCYYDNGYVDIYRMNNTFTGVPLYNSGNVLLTSQVRLFATSVNQHPSDLIWDVLPDSSLPTFQLMTSGSGTWASGTSKMLNSRRVTSISQYSTLSIRGHESQQTVHEFVSTGQFGNSFIQFTGRTTTVPVQFGCAQDDAVAVIDGTRVMTLRKTAPATFSQGVCASGSTPVITSDNLVRLRLFTKAELPSASLSVNCIARISDPASGKGKVVVSNGASWEYMDGTTV